MRFENPTRLQELKPLETLSRIGLRDGQVVCDIGAGSGVFTIPAASLTSNTVFALEINEALIPVIVEKAENLGLKNIRVIKVKDYDFALSTGSVDLVLLVTVFHEIDRKDLFLREVKRILNAMGKVAVIEFHKRETPMGPPLPHRISQEELLAHFSDEGFCLTDSFALGPNFNCSVFEKHATQKKSITN